MPDAPRPVAVTGYERGTITPFGSTRAWPVVADERVRGRRITLGGGEHGVAVAVDADAALEVLGATVADVSDPEPPPQIHRSSPSSGDWRRADDGAPG